MENEKLEKKKPGNNLQEEKKQEKNIRVELSDDSLDDISGGKGTHEVPCSICGKSYLAYPDEVSAPYVCMRCRCIIDPQVHGALHRICDGDYTKEGQ